MTKLNFMQRLSSTLLKMGDGFTKTAMTGIALKSMNSCCAHPSIFSGGCRGFGYGYGGIGIGFGVTPQMMADPMGFSWLPNYSNIDYAQNAAYGNMLAYQYGLNLAARSNAQIAANRATSMQQQQLQKTNADYAGDLEANQETDTGKAFDQATDAMSDKDGNPISGKEYTIIDSYSDPNDAKKCADEYRKAVSDIGKSYAADIDTSSGNSDRKVTVEEFTKYEMSKLSSDATEDTKKAAQFMAQTAFNKIDQNGDGYADWKELASAVATFDTDTESDAKQPLDGKISSNDFAKWSALLSQAGSNEFDINVRKSYTQLFGKNE